MLFHATQQIFLVKRLIGSQHVVCLMSFLLINTGVAQILSGQNDVVVVGGVDTMSDVPIRVSKGMRKHLLALNKVNN